MKKKEHKITFKGKTYDYISDDSKITKGDWCVHHSHGISSLHKCLEIKENYLITESTSKGLLTNFSKLIETNDPNIEL